MSKPELKHEIDSFFDELKREYGLSSLDDDGAPPTPLEEAQAVAEPAADTPPPAPITELHEAAEEETYPGSRHPKRSTLEVEDEPEDPIWDDQPRTYTVAGKSTEFFTVSALATALRRQPVTMRKWEQKGYLPPAQYRSPGEGKKQDRLYTRAQIQGLVAIAREEGLMHPEKKMRIDQTRFPDRAHRLFAALAQRSKT